MNRNAICIAMLSALSVTATAQDSAPVEIKNPVSFMVSAPFGASPDARFRLFPTRNRWTFLQLDTATGRLWQVQFSINEAPAARFVLNRQPLTPSEGKPGRFTLYETHNMWNFLLVDQVDGRVWQTQFTLDKPELSGISVLRESVYEQSDESSSATPSSDPWVNIARAVETHKKKTAENESGAGEH